MVRRVGETVTHHKVPASWDSPLTAGAVPDYSLVAVCVCVCVCVCV